MLSGQDLQMCVKKERVASSWLNALGPIADAFRETVAAFEPLKKALDGVEDLSEAEIDVSTRYKDKLDQAAANFRNNMESLKRFCNRNAKTLLSEVLQERDQVLQSLEERNEYLLAEQAEASQAATEVASKLQATQAALHQSSTGHSNINSTFPLSTEIADKVKAFGNETFAELVLEHLVPKSDSVAQISAAIQDMLQFCSGQVTESMSDIENGVLGVLMGVPRTKLIDGFLRKIWQEYHETLLPIGDAQDALKEFEKTLHEGSLWRKMEQKEDVVKCMRSAVSQLCKLHIYVTACDPPMRLQREGMTAEVPFDALEHAALDDKIKAGTACVVVLPSLRSRDGELKTKALVLAADYL